MAVAPGQVVDELKLFSAPSRWQQSIHIGKAGSGTVIRTSVRSSIVEDEVAGKRVLRIRKIDDAKDGGVPVAARDEVIYQVRCNGIGVVHLRNRPGLIALLVEDRVDRTSRAGLDTPVAAQAEIDLLPVVDVVVDAPGDIILCIYARRIGAEGHGAGDIHSELLSTRAIQVGSGELLRAAAQMTCAVLQGAGACGGRHSAADARSSVVKLKELLIERNRRRRNVIQCVLLQLWRRQRDDSRRRQGVTQPFNIREE